MRGREPELVGRVLLRREGVHLATGGIDRLGDVAGGATFGALERQVFEEVRNPRTGRGFVTVADTDPTADGDGPGVREVLGDHPQPVVESCDGDVFGDRRAVARVVARGAHRRLSADRHHHRCDHRATTAAAAAVAATTRLSLSRGGRDRVGAELAELGAQLVVEGVFERHVLDARVAGTAVAAGSRQALASLTGGECS